MHKALLTLTATASDNVGVTKVEFWEGATKLGEDITSPYSYDWNTTTTTNGAVSLTAKAFDAAGNSTVSASVSATVSNTSSDTTAPATSLTAPTLARAGGGEQPPFAALFTCPIRRRRRAFYPTVRKAWRCRAHRMGRPLSR